MHNIGRWKRLAFVIIILLACTGCDQITKNVARRELKLSAPISLLGDVIRLQYAENPGALMSLGAGLPAEVRFLFFVVLAGAALALTLAYAFNALELSLLQLSGLSLVAAGGTGNLLDRVLYQGVVIDFLNLGIGSLRTGIFNVADVAIFGGAGLVLLATLREWRVRKEG
jgi:signal peptidase II